MAKSKPVQYTELSRELADIVERLGTGELDIDEAVSCYERGLSIVKTLEAHILKAENKITVLRKEFDGDNTN